MYRCPEEGNIPLTEARASVIHNFGIDENDVELGEGTKQNLAITESPEQIADSLQTDTSDEENNLQEAETEIPRLTTYVGDTDENRSLETVGNGAPDTDETAEAGQENGTRLPSTFFKRKLRCANIRTYQRTGRFSPASSSDSETNSSDSDSGQPQGNNGAPAYSAEYSCNNPFAIRVQWPPDENAPMAQNNESVHVHSRPSMVLSGNVKHAHWSTYHETGRFSPTSSSDSE